MADDLEPIRQVFESDLEPYVTPMREGYDEARRFADENRIASDDVQALGSEADRAGEEIRAFAEQNKLAIDGLQRLRDDALEAGHSMSSLRDHEAETAAEAGHLRDDAVGAAEALAHLRDDAAEASHEVKDLGRSADETAAKLDLMGLSGASTGSMLGPLLSVIGLIVVAAAGVAPALAAAGLGLGAFAGFAIPTVKSIFGALKDTHAQLMQLPPAERQVVEGIKGLETEFSAVAKTFQPQVFQIFNQLLGTARTLLPLVIPLARQGGIALSDMVKSISTGVQSSGFLNFMHTMTALVVPATQAITHLAGTILGVLGNALVSLAPLSVPFINLMSNIIKAVGGPVVAALHVLVALIVGLGHAIEPLLPGLSKLATMLINDVGAGFQSFIPIISQVVQLLGGALIKILMDLEPIFANALTPNSGFMMALKLIPDLLHLILPLFETLASILGHPIFAQLAVDAITLVIAFKGLMGIMGLLRGAFIGLTAVMEVNPIILILTAVALLVVAFITLWQHCAAFRDFWKSLWHDIQGAMAPVVAWIKSALADLTAFWNAHWQQIHAILQTVWTLMSGVIKTYVALFVGEIKAGMAIIQGIFRAVWDIISGIVKMNMAVIEAVVQGVMQTIRGVIQFVMDVIHGNWSAAWHDLVNIAQVQIHMVASVIRAVASGFINILFSAGRDIIQGLINGVESMVGSIMSVISGIGHTISSAFSSVLHIFSPSGIFHDHGRNTMLGYINGVLAMVPQVRAVMQQVAAIMQPPRLTPAALYGAGSVNAQAPALAGVGGGAGGGAGPGGTLVVNVDGKRLFEILQSQLYQYNIRNSGQVTGTVKPV